MSSNKVVDLYTKGNCPHCVLAKAFLAEHDVPFREIDISAEPNARTFLTERGHRTVPQLYAGSTLLVEGGNSGLRALGMEALQERLRQITDTQDV